MAEKLTDEAVKRLLSDTSGIGRAEAAAKIASGFNAGAFGAKELQLAEDIFRLMSEDAEVRVRQALAETLKENPRVPHDVAVSLARDVDRVALPILEFSEVLTDSDLLEIIQFHGPEKQTAIAKRKNVSGTVSDALVDTDNEQVVVTLIANKGAALSEPNLQRVVDKFGDSYAMQNVIVHRPNLPIVLSERLLTLVSERLREELAKFQELPADTATDLILQARERAIIGLSSESDEVDVEILVRQLHDNGRLTGAIIVRAGCMGDVTFIEAAMARLVGLPLANARTLIHDSGTLGLEALFKKTDLSLALYPILRAAIDIADETDYDGQPNDRARYQRRILERVLTQYERIGISFDVADFEYLFDKFRDFPALQTSNAA